jgi:hypothetical protein
VFSTWLSPPEEMLLAFRFLIRMGDWRGERFGQ